MGQSSKAFSRTMDALIEQIDRRSMERLARTWKCDGVPTVRRPSMKKYLRENPRVDFHSLFPFLRIEQLEEACRSLRISCTGQREELRLRLLTEYGVDELELGPYSQKARDYREYVTEIFDNGEPITECEFAQGLAEVLGEDYDDCEECGSECNSDESPPDCESEAEPLATPPALAKGRSGLARAGGMQELKRLLQDEVIAPLADPTRHRAYGLTTPNGILLYGPPGCGKTYIAQLLAEELRRPIFHVSHASVGSSLIHETAVGLAKVFKSAADAAPAVVFIDEIDALLPARRDLDGNSEHKAEEVNEMLTQLNNAGERGVVVISATNEVGKLDPAALRPGRFDRIFYVGLPDDESREEILRLELEHRFTEQSIDLSQIVQKTDGYSCAALKLLVDDAARLALKAEKPIGEWFLEKSVSLTSQRRNARPVHLSRSVKDDS